MPNTDGGSLKKLKQYIETKIASIGGGIAYPVGSIYMSMNETDPATIFGGTWEKIADGTFLMAAGATHALGATGGEAEHTLTEEEMPSHNHEGSVSISGTTGSGGSHSHGGSTAGAGAHGHGFKMRNINKSAGMSNMYPYSPSGGQACRIVLNGDTADSTWNSNPTQAFDIDDAGNHSHSLSINSAGSHSHSFSASDSFTTDEAGSGQAHNNLPPFLAINIWKRIA